MLNRYALQSSAKQCINSLTCTVTGMLQAYSELTQIRPCGPRRDAIRAATYDLLDGRGWHEFQSLPQDAWAFLSEVDRQRLQERLLKQS